MASEVEIANAALSRVGANRITLLTENSVEARAVNAIYEAERDAELRMHTWNFAKARAQLASTTAPAFGPSNAFPVPADFIRLIAPDPELYDNELDWRIEGHNILTYDSAPLNIRYIAKITDPNAMDPLFRRVLALRIAREICEPLTQSNAKWQLIDADYRQAISDAKKANAIEVPVLQEPDDTWITARL